MFEQAQKLIQAANDIYIVGHVDPDGDCIGSAFGLCLSLNKIGKNAQVVINKYASTFDFLPNITKHVQTVDNSSYDLLITVDCSDISRLDISTDDFNKAKHVMMIDHHVTTKPFGEVQCVETSLPAACEIVYNFITYLGIDIDTDIATYIYSGLVTDSGNFSYASTKPTTLKTAASLMETGINFSEICKKLNDTIKEGKLKLIARAIENMEVYFDGKLRFTYVSYDEIEKFGITEEDSEGMANYLRMVENTQVAVYVRQKQNGVLRVSMRAGSEVDVSKIAVAFGGGGHARAAGYTMQDGIDNGRKALLEMVEVMIK